MIECLCLICGKKFFKFPSRIKTGRGKYCSVNCKVKSLKGKPGHYKTHGKSDSRIYIIWTNMMQRCYNVKCPAYNRYGGRGITVCSRWHNFEKFFIDMGDPPIGYSLERKENNKCYSPENCKWATSAEQSRNTRRNHFLTYDGEIMTIADWSKKTGIKYETLWVRLFDLNWPTEKALTVSPDIYHNKSTAFLSC